MEDTLQVTVLKNAIKATTTLASKIVLEQRLDKLIASQDDV
jgi:hypothetical protein